MNRYGIVFPRFWNGPTGTALRTCGGRDAQLLALYLMTAEPVNMIGLYFLPISRIQADVKITPKKIAALFVTLACPAADFALYDPTSQFVWVKQIPLFRIPLKPGVVRLEKDDNRAKAANRLYAELPANPFLGPFFDKWAHRLRLTGRRDEIVPG